MTDTDLAARPVGAERESASDGLPARLRRRLVSVGPTTRVTTSVLLALFLIGAVSGVAWFLDDRGVGTDLMGAEASTEGWQTALSSGPVLMNERTLSVTEDASADTLSVRYSVQVPRSSELITQLEERFGVASGDELVASAFGSVAVGEFRYGLTGDARSWVYFTFSAPRVIFDGAVAVVDVESDPMRVYLPVRQLRVGAPTAATTVRSDRVLVDSPGLEAGAVTGGTLDEVEREPGDERSATIERKPSEQLSLTLRDSSVGTAMAAPRAVGGAVLPIGDPFFWRLASLVTFGLFLWGFWAGKGSAEVAPAYRVTRLLMWAIVAEAVVGLSYDAVRALIYTSGFHYALFAGPVGALVVAIVVLWPYACLRTLRPQARPSNWRWRPIGLFAMILLVAGYALLVRQLDPARTVPLWMVATAGAGIAAGAWFFTRLLYVGLAAVPVAILVATVLMATTVGWPTLSFDEFDSTANLLIKPAYLGVCCVAALGLSVLVATVVPGMPTGRTGAALRFGLAAVALAVVMQGAVFREVFHPTVVGAALTATYEFVDDLLGAAFWLVLGIGLVLAIRAGREQIAGGEVTRRLAIAITVSVLFWNDTWMYLPVTLPLAAIVASFLLFPRSLSGMVVATDTRRRRLLSAVGFWRTATVLKAHETALQKDTAAQLKDMLVADDLDGRDYQRRLDTIRMTNDILSDRRKRAEDRAREALAQALSARGECPAWPDGVAGLIIGSTAQILLLAATVGRGLPALAYGDNPVLTFLDDGIWSLVSLPLLGLLFGLFHPLLRGRNSVRKALLVGVVSLCDVPAALVWNTKADWSDYGVRSGIQLALLLALGVAFDLRPLLAAGLRWTDWLGVRNWRFAATWATSVLVAVGVGVTSVVTSSVADLGRVTIAQVTDHGNTDPTNSAKSGR